MIFVTQIAKDDIFVTLETHNFQPNLYFIPPQYSIKMLLSEK